MHRWFGVIVIATWVATLAVMLTMMWDRRWMESDPPAELATAFLHLGAVAAGLALGVALLFRPVRASLSRLQAASYAVAAVLALVSLIRYV